MEGSLKVKILWRVLICCIFCKDLVNGCDSPITECGCSQLKGDSTKYVIDCSDRGLTSVPSINPTNTEFYQISFKSYGSISNKITSLQANAFAGLKVKNIDISTNSLVSVHSDAFSGLESHLETLILDGNSTVSPPFEALKNLTALKTLDLEGFTMNVIMNNTIPVFHNLENLKLKSMNIKTIYPLAFNNKFLKLKKLEITENDDLNSGQIPQAPLRYLPLGLKYLSLMQNKITSVENRAFETLTSLDTLDLSHNSIYDIAEDAFFGLPNTLAALLLNGNKLNSPDLNELKRYEWSNLHQLNFALNPLTTIPPDLFQKMSNLAYLNLHDCQLSSLTSTSFQGLSNLHSLDISQNPIQSIENGTFLHTPLLSILLMDNLNVISITPETFDGLQNSLTELKLQHTLLKDHERMWTVFPTLKNLENLDMMSVGISSIPDCAFYNNNNLKFLYLSQNNITTVNQATFSGLENSLTSLSMQDNSIVNIDKCLIHDLKLEQFSLDKNPLQCDCNMKWYRNKILAENKIYDWILRCDTPLSLQNKLVHNVEDSDLTCLAGTSLVTTCNPNLCEPTTTTIPTTTADIPQIDISDVEISSTESSITISFAQYDTSDIDLFKVTYKKHLTEISNPIIVSGPKWYHTFENLESDTSYELCITAILLNGLETQERCSVYQTKLVNTGQPEGNTQDNSTTYIAIGAVIGCLVAIAIIAIAVYLLIFRKSKKPKELPPVAFTNITSNGLPRESENARRWVKTKPQANGATGACNDIQVSVISDKMHPDDQRISAGSYQSLQGHSAFSTQPHGMDRSHMINSKDFQPNAVATKNKYANIMQKSAGPHYINDPKNLTSPTGGYSNDINNRVLPTIPQTAAKGKTPETLLGYTNKGYKPESTSSQSSSQAPLNTYDEIPL